MKVVFYLLEGKYRQYTRASFLCGSDQMHYVNF